MDIDVTFVSEKFKKNYMNIFGISKYKIIYIFNKMTTKKTLKKLIATAESEKS